ncbi:amastin-like surface protein-like protein [Angomonas deanei]|uniref:Amastin surface glycoprotein, putative n=1 Tax=Angomonas deanei TaxID=59799 RepID=S9U3C6_9TRYP|nr:amastin-like surface protein-like protein [Angomonas deanei]EPY40029.1 amastin-like surface protein-like protein [Angomonas deanei]CAD2221115.1 Amastin surface glycoprotein, putative [Angomonas deanei]|eukprot:EPY25302.1 amastin-like surface protein-like protein [Angomonas deanei]
MAALLYYNGAVVFAFFQFLGFATALIATPTAHFQLPEKGCYTMWGYRKYCGDIPYDATGVEAFGCSKRASTMKVGAVFGVISSILTFTTFILAILLNTRFHQKLPRPVAPIIIGVAIVTTMISWACVASVKNTAMCDGKKFEHPYTAGFALMIASWLFEIISFPLYFLFACGERLYEQDEEDLELDEKIEN